MSKPIRFDPPLVRALAAELHARLAGRGVHPVPLFDRDRSVTLLLDRGEALCWALHPQRGWLRIGPRPDGLGDRPAEARLTRVWSPADERLVYLDLSEGSRFRGAERRLVIELHTNQWNALLVDRQTRLILSALRGRDAGERTLRPGAPYAPPAGARRGEAPREALSDAWRDELGAAPPDARRTLLLSGWADMSPINVGWILGSAAEESDPAALDEAFERWWALHALSRPEPVLLRSGGMLQPYPMALGTGDAEPVPTLLEAFERLAAAPVQSSAVDATAQARAADRRVDQLTARIESMRGQLAAAEGADAVRAIGDLILARLDAVPHGADQVVLTGFDGAEVVVALEPTLRPSQNADALYERARRMERAAARLPALLWKAELELERWRAAVEEMRQGVVPPWAAAELGRTAREKPGDAPVRLPYRVYRTSGGLEVRVGRTRVDNDRLTFRHAAPDDVWLHARQVPGSHVVLRWTSAEAPPARDLEEAAALAAWHSRARSSATVPVDWTRRRHVRKPRGAPPGRVAVLRAKTLFVEPTAREEAS